MEWKKQPLKPVSFDRLFQEYCAETSFKGFNARSWNEQI